MYFFSLIRLDHIAIENTPAMSAYVYTPIFFRVACYLKDQSPTVLIIVYSNPGFAFIIRAKNAIFAIDGSGQI